MGLIRLGASWIRNTSTVKIHLEFQEFSHFKLSTPTLGLRGCAARYVCQAYTSNEKAERKISAAIEQLLLPSSPRQDELSNLT
jgi:hypothetical protein